MFEDSSTSGARGELAGSGGNERGDGEKGEQGEDKERVRKRKNPRGKGISVAEKSRLQQLLAAKKDKEAAGAGVVGAKAKK